MNQETILAGTSIIDITPPLEVGLLTSSVKGEYMPFQFVRLPLKARVLALKSGTTEIAIISLELLALTDTSVGGWEKFKKDISENIAPEKIIITCTHTHNAPESVGLSNLYLTEVYHDWITIMKKNLKEGIKTAFSSAKPAALFIGHDILEGYTLQRRIETAQGIIMSDSIQPISKEIASRQPVDRRVHKLRLEDTDHQGIATIVQAVCHPVNEMCMPHVSSDFPGEMCKKMELSFKNGMPLFLNGAAGDTNPMTVSMGPEYSEKQGTAIANLVEENITEIRIDHPSLYSIHSEIKFPVRTEAGVTNPLDAMARFSVIALGNVAVVFLPGEPFIDIALEIERQSPFEQTVIAGYGENNIGYIPTENAFVLGGYETGPGKWSFLKPGTDRLMCLEALRLLTELHDRC